VKRQAARFRIYAFDKDGKVIREITHQEGTVSITWKAELKNKKCSYFQFNGRYNQQMTISNLRNNKIQPTLDVESRTQLIIDPGARTIKGINKKDVKFDGGKIYGKTEVVLGELRTDESGRLLVLGGFGRSESVIENNSIGDYANNDNWFDDTSDGTIHATVIFADGSSMEADPAWVLVGPPKFAPNHYNLVSLYDRIYERSVIPAPEEKTDFYKHIYPILFRAANYAWVNGLAHRGHTAGMNGNFLTTSNLTMYSCPDEFTEVWKQDLTSENNDFKKVKVN
jgi:hypothetical protein